MYEAMQMEVVESTYNLRSHPMLIVDMSFRSLMEPCSMQYGHFLSSGR